MYFIFPLSHITITIILLSIVYNFDKNLIKFIYLIYHKIIKVIQ